MENVETLHGKIHGIKSKNLKSLIEEYEPSMTVI